jgi:hypothetical protein
MTEILGKWQQPSGQPFPGLWFEFKTDGTFHAELAEMGITSGGTYQAEGDHLDMDQTQHTLGLLGKFYGLFSIDGDTLTMTLNDPGGPRPTSPEGKNKRLYKRIA